MCSLFPISYFLSLFIFCFFVFYLVFYFLWGKSWRTSEVKKHQNAIVDKMDVKKENAWDKKHGIESKEPL